MFSGVLTVLSILCAFLAASDGYAIRPSSFSTGKLTRRQLSPGDYIDPVVQSISVAQHSVFSDTFKSSMIFADEAVSLYSKVDKTGFIGGIANYVEQAIDLSHVALQSFGLKYTYGFSILIFTLLVKLITLPLTRTQLESTTKMQQLAPLQQKIQAKYANDEQTKNQMLSQLFQTANVNPLAGCLPALVQIPVFLSLYRALQNLIAENKLDEPFLWIPDLEGPVYSNPPGTSMDWIKTAFSGTPSLGWEDTLAFMSLPVILFISQTLSQKVLQPPKDPNKVLSEQEQISQGIVGNLPFIIAFFSINVPAGLSIYWIANNILTTAVTVVVKNEFKDQPMPVEVDRMMASIAGPTPTSKSGSKASALQELKGFTSSAGAAKPKSEGFASPMVVDVDATVNNLMQGEDSSTEDAAAVVEAAMVASGVGDGEGSKKRSAKKDKKKRAQKN